MIRSLIAAAILTATASAGTITTETVEVAPVAPVVAYTATTQTVAYAGQSTGMWFASRPSLATRASMRREGRLAARQARQTARALAKDAVLLSPGAVMLTVPVTQTTVVTGYGLFGSKGKP